MGEVSNEPAAVAGDRAARAGNDTWQVHANAQTNKPVELQVDDGVKAGNDMIAPDPVVSASGTSPTTPASAGAKSAGVGPQYSCISGSNNNNEQRMRTDSRGTIIQKGEKKHKAVWADEVRQGASVQEVKEVKSFKNGSMGCKCSIM